LSWGKYIVPLLLASFQLSFLFSCTKFTLSDNLARQSVSHILELASVYTCTKLLTTCIVPHGAGLFAPFLLVTAANDSSLIAMSLPSITLSSANATPFEQVSGTWENFLAVKPYREFKRSNSQLDFALIETTNALGNWLSHLQLTMAQQGLVVSELVLVLWVLQCFEPGLRSLLEKSLGKELVAENVGFNTLKLHLEVWDKTMDTEERRKWWNQKTKGQVDIFEFWAAQGAQMHSYLVLQWKHVWDRLSGKHGAFVLFMCWIRAVLTCLRLDVKMTDAPPLW
jgi:hypothetical protein